MTQVQSEERPTKGDRTRDAIRAAALSCFSELGYDAATTAEIGRRAGVSEATVFNHFTSKPGLLTALMEDFYAILQRESEEAAAGPGDPEARFRRLIDTWASRVERDWNLVHVFGQRARYGSDPELARTFTELNRHFTRIHLDLIEDLRNRGVIADDLPAVLVRDLLFGGLEHTALGQVAAGRPVALRDAGHRVADLILGPGASGDQLADIHRTVGRIAAHLGVGPT